MLSVNGAQPVVDFKVKNFIETLNCSADLFNINLKHEFVNNFVEWIESSRNNKLSGLANFNYKTVVAGTAQTFDHFYWQHKKKRFRFFCGEFMYHSAFLKNGGDWCFLEDARLDKNDALIISVPFSDSGSQRNDMDFFLHNCTALNIPVLLDFAYYPCAKNINIDLDCYPCVETVTFSISKAFYGAEYLRAGIRLQRINNDDGIDVLNHVNMINRVSLSIANSLIKTYTVDHNWNEYSMIYEKVCKDLNLTQTDCIMFGLGGEEYQRLNRGGAHNRVCISEYIGREISRSIE
jgi:hypothetical protein